MLIDGGTYHEQRSAVKGDGHFQRVLPPFDWYSVTTWDSLTDAEEFFQSYTKRLKVKISGLDVAALRRADRSGRDRVLLLHPPLRTVRATFTAHGGGKSVMLLLPEAV
ncbi:hypothetical protein NKDENANG_02512 [Candidatus Entotheonellaceae bacterium PAL068K]